MVDMSVTLADVDLPNPLMTASGCAANGKELHRFFDVSTLGAFVGKTSVKDGKAVMVDSVYRDGAHFLPSEADVGKVRPKD